MVQINEKYLLMIYNPGIKVVYCPHAVFEQCIIKTNTIRMSLLVRLQRLFLATLHLLLWRKENFLLINLLLFNTMDINMKLHTLSERYSCEICIFKCNYIMFTPHPKTEKLYLSESWINNLFAPYKFRVK